MSALIRKTVVKKLCKEHGRILSTAFYNQLENYLEEKIIKACQMHNGGKKILDIYVFFLSFRGGKP